MAVLISDSLMGASRCKCTVCGETRIYGASKDRWIKAFTDKHANKCGG